MNLDPHNWSPLSPAEVAEVLAGMPVPWWIAGGVALDLFLGRAMRTHEDIDIQVLRRDQLIVQEHLQQHWRLFKTKQPTPPHLAPWPSGEFLEPPINSVWVRRPGEEAWAYMFMFMEAEGDRWVYRRLPALGGRIADMGLTTDAGIPYLAPEIQLLYKSSTGREKDADDLRRVLPRLPLPRAYWLLDALRTQYSDGHDWIGLIEEKLEVL